MVQIKSVISDNLIELFLDCASDDEISFPIFSFFSLSGENHTFSWVVGLGKISLYDTIIFGRNTSFIEIGKNDIIAVIIENKKIELFVKEVFSNEILIIETHPLKNIEFDGEYLIGKQLSKEIEDSDNEKIHEEKDSLSILKIV